MAYLGRPILGDDKYGDRALNKRLGFANRLCLWCERIAIGEGGALSDWSGMEFRAEAPEWVKV